MKYRKKVYLVCGIICVLVGAIGIVLPILPTTPFLLLAAYLFLRSSPKFYFWLISNRMLGRYIYCYLQYRAVERRSKISALILLWIGLSISMVLTPSWVKILLFFIGVGVSIHLLMLQTLTPQTRKQIEQDYQQSRLEQ